MRALLSVAAIISVTASALARAESPPYQAELSEWTGQCDYNLRDFRNCKGFE